MNNFDNVFVWEDPSDTAQAQQQQAKLARVRKDPFYIAPEVTLALLKQASLIWTCLTKYNRN